MGFRPAPQFLRFCIVGGLGFLIDAATLEWLVMHAVSAPAARLASIALALQATYLLHGIFTFRGHRGYSWRGWRRFIGLNLIGATINYLTFFGMLGFVFTSDTQPARLASLLVATVVALVFNYSMNRRFVFPPREEP